MSTDNEKKKKKEREQETEKQNGEKEQDSAPKKKREEEEKAEKEDSKRTSQSRKMRALLDMDHDLLAQRHLALQTAIDQNQKYKQKMKKDKIEKLWGNFEQYSSSKPDRRGIQEKFFKSMVTDEWGKDTLRMMKKMKKQIDVLKKESPVSKEENKRGKKRDYEKSPAEEALERELAKRSRKNDYASKLNEEKSREKNENRERGPAKKERDFPDKMKSGGNADKKGNDLIKDSSDKIGMSAVFSNIGDDEDIDVDNFENNLFMNAIAKTLRESSMETDDE